MLTRKLGLGSINRQLSYDDTIAREGRAADHLFRARIKDVKAFDAAVMDHGWRTWWIYFPERSDQTQCTRAAYDAIRAGGIAISCTFPRVCNWPEVFGDALQDLSKKTDSGVRQIK
jgi:hypothetical protein